MLQADRLLLKTDEIKTILTNAAFLSSFVLRVPSRRRRWMRFSMAYANFETAPTKPTMTAMAFFPYTRDLENKTGLLTSVISVC